MWKLKFFLGITILGFIFLGSCNRKNNDPAIYGSWGIVLNPSDGSPEFILDWSFPRKIKINNINNIGNISTIPDSIRLFMYYSFVNPSVDSTLINVNTISTTLTKKLQYYNGPTSIPDTFGTNPLYNVNGPFVSQNYLTIPFAYYYSNPTIPHMISLVHNANNNLWGTTTYDTMYVEFRHNANGDEGGYYSSSGTNYVAFNLNPQRPTGITKDSFYIKMSYTTANLSTGSESKTIIIPAKWQ